MPFDKRINSSLSRDTNSLLDAVREGVNKSSKVEAAIRLASRYREEYEREIDRVEQEKEEERGRRGWAKTGGSAS